MHDNKGYYKLLNLKPGASVSEVKKAYNLMLMKYHPDMGSIAKQLKTIEDEAERNKKFEEINEMCKKLNDAKTVLTDSEKKELYDQGVDENASGYDMSGFDIFEFMGGRRDKGPKKVANTEFHVKLTLKDSFLGRKKTFSVKREVICTACEGRGGEKSTMCATCKGEGEIGIKRQMGLIFSIDRSACPDCRGSGHIVEGPLCSECKGQRYCQKQESVTVTFDKGFKNDDTVVCRGKGDEHVGCIPGDLVLIINIKEDQHFKRVDNHIVTTADIDLYTALVGGTITLRHVDDSVLNVKMDRIKNLREGVIIVKGAGFPGGDLHIIPNFVYGNVKEEELKKVLPCPKLSKNNGVACTGTQGKLPTEKKRNANNFKENIFSQFFRGF